MLFKKHLLLSVILLVSFLSNSQTNNRHVPIKKYEQQFLDILFRDSSSSVHLKLKEGVFRFGFTDAQFGAIAIVKKQKKVLIQLLGTGRVYQINKLGNKYLFERIDSTTHSGVNFEAYTFFHNDTLFQYGGTGFWKIRGIITYYSDITHEWELLPANRELENSNDDRDFKLFKIDQLAHKMYISGSMNYADFPATLNAKILDSCFEFDFNTRKWRTLGKMNPILMPNLTRSNDLNINIGHYIGFQKELEFYWANFFNNTYGRLKEAKNNQIRLEWIKLFPASNALKEQYMQFHIGDTLFLATIKENGELHYKPILLREQDFDLSNTLPIYDPINVTFQKLKIIFNAILTPILGLAILVFLIWLVLRRFIRRKKMPKEVVTILYNNFYTSLTVIEKELIEALYNQQIKGEELSTKVINKILGVQQKDTLTQNKSRSDHFIKINQKFNLATQQTDALIVKKRDLQDKRQFNYSLNESYLTEIEKLLKD